MGSRIGKAGWTRPAVAVLSAVITCASASATAAAVPSVRLFGTVRRATVTQNELRAGSPDLGLWIAATGDTFQVNVARPGYGAWTAAQVDANTGAVQRSIPIGLVDPGAGLKRFLSIRFVDGHGRTAARRFTTFCPNGQASRVDESGPLESTYLVFCGNEFDPFPFVRGAVWGINRGWAVPPTLGSGPFSPIGFIAPGPFSSGFVVPRNQWWVSLKPGRYTAVVSIGAAYRRLFSIPQADASVRLAVRVLYSRPPRVQPPRPPAQGGKPEDAADARGPRLARTISSPSPTTTPNLVAAPAWRITVRPQHQRDVLRFDATIWNAGPAPFSIEGFRRPHSDLMDAYEYFFDAAGNVVGRAPAGTLEYDSRPGHHHWHLRQLASYALVGGARTILSEKQSFCIAPTDAVDLTVPGAQGEQVFASGLGFGSACDLYSPGAIWLREALPVGWGDTYEQVVAGQAFDITHVPNGRYKIAVRVNPLGLLHEASTRDDIAYRQIRLLGRRGARHVVVAPWRGITG